MGDQTRYIEATSVNVTDAAVAIVGSSGQSARRSWVHIVNMGTNIVYIGGDGVTSANGYPIPPRDLPNGIDGEKEIENHSGSVYAICATGQSATLKILTQRD